VRYLSNPIEEKAITISCAIAVVIISHSLFQSGAHAPTGIVITANEAAAYIGEHVAVEGVVARISPAKATTLFLAIGGGMSEPDFHWLDLRGSWIIAVRRGKIVQLLIQRDSIHNVPTVTISPTIIERIFFKVSMPVPRDGCNSITWGLWLILRWRDRESFTF
jgi:hypothetical protein